MSPFLPCDGPCCSMVYGLRGMTIHFFALDDFWAMKCCGPMAIPCVGGAIGLVLSPEVLGACGAQINFFCSPWSWQRIRAVTPNNIGPHHPHVQINQNRVRPGHTSFSQAGRGRLTFTVAEHLFLIIAVSSYPTHTHFAGMVACIDRCGVCDKIFDREDKMQIHQGTHARAGDGDFIRPYPCNFPGCGKSFTEKRNLNAHRRTRHTEVILVHLNK